MDFFGGTLPVFVPNWASLSEAACSSAVVSLPPPPRGLLVGKTRMEMEIKIKNVWRLVFFFKTSLSGLLFGGR